VRNRLEHRLGVGRRGGDHPQHFTGGGLLGQCLAQFRVAAFQLRSLGFDLFKKIDVFNCEAYAKENNAIILYDAAYEAFIQDPEVPRSIFEIEGARECAMEFRSFSKNGGFTGTRCAYTVIPKTLMGSTADGKEQSLHSLWSRRHSTKFNGASYPVQKGAAAVFSDEGKKQVAALIEGYMGNAKLLREACLQIGLPVFGGVNAPYVWVGCPEGLSSWDMFDRMLSEANVVITPGAGFGAAGEGYFRISAFNTRKNVEEVCRRIIENLG
jgi:LL-diaminopimelate aminotransferase